MTPDEDEYRFTIDAYSPKTIPMSRLVDYMALLADLYGNDAYVHFDRLEPGSTQVVSRVEREAIPKVAERVHESASPGGARELRKLYKRLDTLVRSDNAVGQIKRRQSGSPSSAQIVYFPGRDLKGQKYGPFNQPAVIDGVIFRIGGKDTTAHALIEDAEGNVIPGEMNRDLAKQIGRYLYESLRFDGEARRRRLENGEWDLLGFKIKSFIPHPESTLIDSINRLRQIPGSEWSALDDPIGTLHAERAEDNDG